MTDTRSPRSLESIERRILDFIHSELLAPGERLGRDDELLTGGLLDSIGAVRLASFVEEEFEFKMSPADFLVENFRTVAVLAEFVQRVSGR